MPGKSSLMLVIKTFSILWERLESHFCISFGEQNEARKNPFTATPIGQGPGGVLMEGIGSADAKTLQEQRAGQAREQIWSRASPTGPDMSRVF